MSGVSRVSQHSLAARVPAMAHCVRSGRIELRACGARACGEGSQWGVDRQHGTGSALLRSLRGSPAGAAVLPTSNTQLCPPKCAASTFFPSCCPLSFLAMRCFSPTFIDVTPARHVDDLQRHAVRRERIPQRLRHRHRTVLRPEPQRPEDAVRLALGGRRRRGAAGRVDLHRGPEGGGLLAVGRLVCV